MVKIYYYDIREFPLEQFDNIINLLPQMFHNEILKYNLVKDQVRCLIGKIFIYKNYLDDHHSQLSFIRNWYRDINNKPHLSFWNSFNISHSGDYVVYAESRDYNELGIDLEKINPRIDSLELASFFCEEEKKEVQLSNDPIQTFFQLWVRKEALLKASGIGIVNGLDGCNCLKDEIFFHQKRWTIVDIPFSNEYSLSLALNSLNDKNIIYDIQLDINLLKSFIFSKRSHYFT